MANIELSTITAESGGFVMNGERSNDYSGFSVAADDINGDGLDGLIVGAHGSDVNGSASDRSYGIFGSATGALANTAVDDLGGKDADTLTDKDRSDHTLVSGVGNNSITGNVGAAVIYAGIGDDSINLNASDTTDISTANANQLDGAGRGADTFVFNITPPSKTNLDIITDVEIGSENIALDDKVFK